MTVKFVCDHCNKFEVESDDTELVRQKMIEHCKEHDVTNFFTDIVNFHKKFDLQQLERPGFLSSELMKFRIKFMQEELDEFCDAYIDDDVEKAFDALIDLCYVVLGTSYLMGFPFIEGWNHVHYCNMQKVRAKVDGSDSKRKSSFDVVKPIDWQAPNLASLIFEICDKCNKHHNVGNPCK